jgi:hypothetical protein
VNVDILKATLDSKLTSLSADLDAWKEIAENPRQEPVFAKHQSQIIRLHELFTGLIENLKDQISRLPVDVSFKAADDLSDKILQGHALWSYFRDKLLLRRADNLRRYLSAADEFAWACFEPLCKKRLEVSGNMIWKSPPLIFLGRENSPFVYPRNWSLDGQIPDVTDEVFNELVKCAPMSVVSLPFYQATHLPETLVLAHEMGHVIEMDLGLSAALNATLENVSSNELTDAHKTTWKQWRVEAFADIFGATVARAGFCRALANFLATDHHAVVNEEISASAYPTIYLRVLLALEVLRDNDGHLPPEASALESEWRDYYGSTHKCQDYEIDLKIIVKCFIDNKLEEFGGETIRAIATPKSSEDVSVKMANDMLVNKIKPDATNDPRVIMEAAAIAFYQKPKNYKSQEVEKLVLDRIEEVANNAPRKIADEILRADKVAGGTLAGLLGEHAKPGEAAKPPF